MDKFVGASFWQSKDIKCMKCGMIEKNKKGCCKDENKQIKIEKAHQKSISDFNFLFVKSPVILSTFICNSFTETKLLESLPSVNTPPPKRSVPIYILNCEYLI